MVDNNNVSTYCRKDSQAPSPKSIGRVRHWSSPRTVPRQAVELDRARVSREVMLPCTPRQRHPLCTSTPSNSEFDSKLVQRLQGNKLQKREELYIADPYCLFYHDTCSMFCSTHIEPYARDSGEKQFHLPISIFYASARRYSLCLSGRKIEMFHTFLPLLSHLHPRTWSSIDPRQRKRLKWEALI